MVPVVLSKSTLFLALFFVEFTPNLLAGVALRPRPTGTNNRAVHCRRRRRRRCTLFSLSLSLSLFLFRFRANRWLAGVIGSRHHNGRNVEEHACHRTNWGEAGVSAIFLISGHLRFSPRWFLDQKHTYIEREREKARYTWLLRENPFLTTNCERWPADSKFFVRSSDESLDLTSLIGFIAPCDRYASSSGTEGRVSLQNDAGTLPLSVMRELLLHSKNIVRPESSHFVFPSNDRQLLQFEEYCHSVNFYVRSS